jgi:hypothetical protein
MESGKWAKYAMPAGQGYAAGVIQGFSGTSTKIMQLMKLDLYSQGLSSGRTWSSGFRAGGNVMSTYRPGGKQGGGIVWEADGGVVDRPQFSMVGEAGAEAIVPLTNPTRAAEVMEQAGLTTDTATMEALLGAILKAIEQQPRKMVQAQRVA